MVKTLQELIKLKSVRGEPLQDIDDGLLPFGNDVHQAFKYMLNLGRKDDFTVENVDNYGGHIEFGGLILDSDDQVVEISDEIVGILGHLDVVPEGNDWNYSPFGGEIKEGRIYGRGASDNKGPIVATYYAMKALKESGFVPEKKIRLILGLDEETKWEGINYYFSKENHPTIGFTPDAEFPVINGEKGIITFELAKKIGKTNQKGLQLISLSGGNAANMVADTARAVLRGDDYDKVRDIVSGFKKERGHSILVKGIGKNLEIITKGISAHGARPEKGLNSISIMMELLGKLPIINEDILEFIDFSITQIGFKHNGQSLGCGYSDSYSVKLNLNVGMASLNKEIGKLVINIRYPISMDQEDIYSAINENVQRHSFGIIRINHQKPIFFKEDDPLIRTLMEIYEKHTSDKDSKPIVIGGGTYARATDNIVAFGATFKGEEEVAHQKNEYISVESLVKVSKIYADAIYSLCKI